MNVAAPPVTAGQPAPDFTLPVVTAEDAPGAQRTVTLSALRGRPVVLYFYPKDDTPGCTAQACGFRDTMGDLQAMGAAVIGVSKDGPAAHAKFIKKFALNFPLASDTDGAVCDAYGTWVEKSMYGKKYMGIDRATFLIDAAGTVTRVWRKVSVPGHVAEVATALNQLGKQANDHPAPKRQSNDGNGTSSPAPRPKTRTAALAQRITDANAGIASH